MHVGRRYPFAPEFWVTTAWFWPGFLPWKMMLTSSAVSFFPYTYLPYGTMWVSEEIEYDPDINVGLYKWDFHPAYPLKLALRLDFAAGSPKPFARWHGVVNVDADVDRILERLQVFPQRQVKCDDILQIIPTSPSGGPAGIVPWQFRPATYAEGGTPWPNY